MDSTNALNITLVSQTPSDFNISTSGFVELVFNVSSNYPGESVNWSSCYIAQGVNFSGMTDKWAVKFPSNSKADHMYRAHGRNESRFFESDFSDIVTWGAADKDTSLFFIQKNSSTTGLLNWTPSFFALVPAIFPLDASTFFSEPRTNKYVNITNKGGNLIAQFSKPDVFGGDFFQVWTYIKQIGYPSNPLEFFYCNSSWEFQNESG
ncbi:hypothetical protein DRJ25_02020, partial [Candidatus Woesearchaeota archaeon]